MLIFAKLSGDNPDLGIGEARALCESMAGGHAVIEYNPPVAVLECPREVDLGGLGGFVSESGMLLWRGHATELYSAAIEIPSIEVPAKADAEGFGSELNERVTILLGERLISAGVRVDVRRPGAVLKAYRMGDTTYVAVIHPHKGKWRLKDVRSRPFRHPSVLVPRLARALVNLSRPRMGGVLLDPFSGTGGVLEEAEDVGCLPVGVDLDWRMARGSLKNVKWRGSLGGIVRGDARVLPISRANCVASDLPYGRMSSAMGSTTEELLRHIVEELPDFLEPGGYAALMVRERVQPASANGVNLVETYLHKVHDALTRKIFVYKVTGR
ncbi:MAG TPA: hypothetical protein ENO38_00820 [Nitrososphaeria archaeon]|nr:hypothetical protein [Nitrososphaeria archaeon]